MDDREKLLEKYDELITKSDSESKFDLFDVIIMLQDELKLEDFLFSNKNDLIKIDPVKFIGKHIQYYLCQDDYITALRVLSEYQNAPFINLTVEDFMKDLESEIKKQYMPKNKSSYDRDKVVEDLDSKNEERIAHAINFLSTTNIRNYIDIIKKYLISGLEYRFKLLLEFILIEQKVDEDFLVTKGDLEFKIHPSKELLPFEKNKFKECINYLERMNESPSVIQNSEELLKIYEVKNYPTSLLDDEDITIVAEVLCYLVKTYLKEDVSLSEVCFQTGLDEDEIVKLIEKIQNGAL